jgi:deoxyribodipyrimidine photo-lyase
MRIYNPVKQGLDHDPDGQFVRAHLPELSEVPDTFLHEPWAWLGAARLAYPPPLVDNAAAARAAREAVHAVRQGPAHGAQARDILARHGSRKAGMPMRGRRRKPVASSPASPGSGTQLTLDL